MNGVIQDNDDSISKAFIDYFSAILANPTPMIPNLSPLFKMQVPFLNKKQASDLIREVLPEEIKRAVFSLKYDSSGGPDGFNAFFYQHTWKIIKHDVNKAIQYFFCHNKLPTGVNTTNIALVPKCPNTVSVSVFRPISCCNVLYKIISKIIANILQSVLPSIISSNQVAFMPHRNISDNILLT